MDLEAIWQEHKSFIIRVGAGALAFLVLSSYQGSVLHEASALYVKSNQTEEDLLAMAEDLAGAEGREKGRGETLDERLQPAVIETLLWKSAEAYQLPTDEKSPLLFYATAVEQAVRNVNRAASSWNAQVPRTAEELNLPQEIGDARVPEALGQVNVIESLVRRMIDAGVRTIRHLDPGDVDYSPLGGVGGYLREIEVEVEFEASTRILARVLAEIQVSGSFLEVVTCEVVREGDKPSAPLVTTLRVRALSQVEVIPQDRSLREEDKERPSRGRRRRVSFERER